MTQPYALNASGGEAATVKARMPDADVARLLAVAARQKVSRSALIRRALALGLDYLERDEGPPGRGGGTSSTNDDDPDQGQKAQAGIVFDLGVRRAAGYPLQPPRLNT